MKKNAKIERALKGSGLHASNLMFAPFKSSLSEAGNGSSQSVQNEDAGRRVHGSLKTED